MSTRTCADCALHLVTYRHDIEVAGNEYEGTCRAGRWTGLPTARWHDDAYAQKCQRFQDKTTAKAGRNVF